MDGGMFRGFETLIKGCFIIIAISLPLALWKLIDVVIWVFNNLEGVG